MVILFVPAKKQSVYPGNWIGLFILLVEARRQAPKRARQLL